MQITDLDKRIIKAFQEDIPLIEEPFKLIAEEIGCSEEELLTRLKLFKDQGIMRRLGAVLRHREVGFAANALCVWVVPEEDLDRIAESMCKHPAVTHCYDRNTAKDWPYNLYTMIHGNTEEECREIVAKLSEETGISEVNMLFSKREWKKTSMKYYMEKEV